MSTATRPPRRPPAPARQTITLPLPAPHEHFAVTVRPLATLPREVRADLASGDPVRGTIGLCRMLVAWDLTDAAGAPYPLPRAEEMRGAELLSPVPEELLLAVIRAVGATLPPLWLRWKKRK